MVTGASTADVAVILVDARKGVVEQTRRHGYIASILAIAARRRSRSTRWTSSTSPRSASRSIEADLHELGSTARPARPDARSRSRRCAATTSSTRTDSMPWYDGPTLLAAPRDDRIAADRNLHDRRFPVQWVIRPTGPRLPRLRGPGRGRRLARRRRGRRAAVGPSLARRGGRDARTAPLDAAVAPMSVTIRLEDDLDVSRGDLLADPDRPPIVARSCSRASAG